ncbi:Interferon- developmental regulator 1 [Chamberlinius hualienensis]
MPKGKRRIKQDKRRPETTASDDNDSVNDNGSLVSSISEIQSIGEEGAGCNGTDVDGETISEVDLFEDKLKDAIEGATQKSAKGRQTCLEAIAKAFMSRYVYDFVVERRATIVDCIERSLKKGKGAEQAAAALVASLLCIQLGAGDESNAVFKELKQTLLAIASDNSVPADTRGKCYTTLGMCTFIAGVDDEVDEIVKVLQSTFSLSYLKKNGASPTVTPDQTALHNNALAAWSLLLTILEYSQLEQLIESDLYRLPQLLESSDVELRITTGETMAIFYEILRKVDDNFEGDDFEELCDTFKKLATDSQKFRAKKERKQQRSSFRDVLKAIEERELPNIQVKFGREVLELDEWCKKRQYDAFCQVLGSGMNLHLSENYLLREIFSLGEPLSATDYVNQKISKHERHLVNSATFKARTLARSKMRDKRNVVF